MKVKLNGVDGQMVSRSVDGDWVPGLDSGPPRVFDGVEFVPDAPPAPASRALEVANVETVRIGGRLVKTFNVYAVTADAREFVGTYTAPARTPRRGLLEHYRAALVES